MIYLITAEKVEERGRVLHACRAALPQHHNASQPNTFLCVSMSARMRLQLGLEAPLTPPNALGRKRQDVHATATSQKFQ